MPERGGPGFREGFMFPWKAVDDRIGAVAQSFVNKMADRGTALPVILRDAVFHSLASFALAVALAFLFEEPRTAGWMLLFLIMVLPGETRLWRRHAARAKTDWSPELAAACMVEAELRKRRFLWFRSFILIGLLAETLALAINPGTFTPFDFSGIIMIVVLGARFHLECAAPRPPSRRRQAAGRLAPTT